MKITKRQLMSSLCDYVEQEMLPVITDNPTKILLSSAVHMLTKSNGKIEKLLLSQPIFQFMLNMDEDGYYDLTDIIDGLPYAVERYGALEMEFDGIPLLSKEKQKFRFGKEDFEKIRKFAEEKEHNDY